MQRTVRWDSPIKIGEPKMPSRIEIEIDPRPPNTLTKEELDAEMMLLWTTITKLGERHRALQRERDTRQTQSHQLKVDEAIAKLIAMRTPKTKRRL